MNIFSLFFFINWPCRVAAKANVTNPYKHADYVLSITNATEENTEGRSIPASKYAINFSLLHTLMNVRSTIVRVKRDRSGFVQDTILPSTGTENRRGNFVESATEAWSCTPETCATTISYKSMGKRPNGIF